MNDLIIGKRQALSNWVRQFVTIVDVQRRVYKLQESLFGVFKWGVFRDLPKIDYVLIFRSLFVKCEACAINEFKDNPNLYYQVSLVYNGNRKIVIEETKKRTEAFSLAQKIALGLKTRIKDSASVRGKSTWLNAN